MIKRKEATRQDRPQITQTYTDFFLFLIGVHLRQSVDQLLYDERSSEWIRCRLLPGDQPA